jgi:hypothetical protein
MEVMLHKHHKHQKHQKHASIRCPHHPAEWLSAQRGTTAALYALVTWTLGELTIPTLRRRAGGLELVSRFTN